MKLTFAKHSAVTAMVVMVCWSCELLHELLIIIIDYDIRKYNMALLIPVSVKRTLLRRSRDVGR